MNSYSYVRLLYVRMTERYPRFAHMLRFGISGGMSALLQVSVFAFVFHGMALHYIGATVIAVICGTTLNFFLQKMWSFKNAIQGATHTTVQFSVFALNGAFNLLANAALMTILVEKIFIQPVLAQALCIVVLMFWNFAVYGRIFRK